jgi:PIN domain nuclease of toxin-antitoxin system
MRLLLDTHSFLWFISGSSNLSGVARDAIEGRENERLLSVASLWEMSIKVSLGKLQLALPFPELVERQVYGNAISLLAIAPEHLDELARLPFHHKDPFDRLIIAQSFAEDITLVGNDSAFERYPVKMLW